MVRYDFYCAPVVKKSWEHRAKSFLAFIDLKKAYNSIPREALWLVLSKLGVLEPTIKLIRSFHCGLQAQIRLDDVTLDPIDINNGLCQGCCMAPVLFNFYSCLVLKRWNARASKLEGAGIHLMYKPDRKLFRQYARNAEEVNINECQ